MFRAFAANQNTKQKKEAEKRNGGNRNRTRKDPTFSIHRHKRKVSCTHIYSSELKRTT